MSDCSLSLIHISAEAEEAADREEAVYTDLPAEEATAVEAGSFKERGLLND